ncbi:zinc-binding protein A33-like [Engraulis encrasicolus]|uniref:zinc-binding protein A33-like n=1 Tax=Engraulis encrasicolus TaxID=184585 RepID=UPI002FD34F53
MRVIGLFMSLWGYNLEKERKVSAEEIKPLEENLEKFERVKCNLDKTAEYIKVQAQQAERQIKQEFDKLYQFLREEEAARIAALRKEEEQKTQMMKDKIEKIDADIKTLLHTIRSIKEDVGKDDIIFLKNFRGTIKRAKSKLQVPDRSEGTLINMAKHLGNLTFRVWRKVKDNVQYTPVTLDPNTAHSQLLLSEDLTSVAYIEEPQDVPDNPERFDKYPNVLGSVGFDTGTPSWEVEIRDVKDGQFWGLGVRAESDQRKGRFSAKSGVWSVSCADGKYSAVSPSQKHTLLKVEEVQRIKVQLDYEKGKLSFSDADNSTLIHTFTDTFTERVFPFFYGKASFSILPRAFIFKYNKVHKKRDLTI